MLQNLSTRAKLFLFPAILALLLGGIFFVYHIESNKARFFASMSRESSILLETFLRLRILRYQDQLQGNKDAEIIEAMDSLRKETESLASKLKIPENQARLKENLELFKQYTSYYHQRKQLRADTSIDQDTKKAKNTEITKAGTIVAAKMQENFEMTLKTAAENSSKQLIRVEIAIIVLFVVAFVIFVIFSLLLIRNILGSLSAIRDGLKSFFSFVGRESSEAKIITLNSKDEFGKMAIMINESIEKIQATIKQDTSAVEEVIHVVSEIRHGHLKQQLSITPSSPELRRLSGVLNEMLVVLRTRVADNLNELQGVLDSYSRMDFTTSIKEPHGGIECAVNFLGNEITKMLQSSLDAGKLMQ
ncbi:MAG: HAMP domain-containing protein, partial [Wolinella sp.]